MNSLKQFINSVLFIFIIRTLKAFARPELVITNNGPAILNSELTFTAVLSHYTEIHPLTFVFDDGIKKIELEHQHQNVSLKRSFSSDEYQEGTYRMNVTVTTYRLFYTETVAENSSTFHLKRDLIGSIGVYRSSGSQIDVDEIAVRDNVTFVVNLIDNNNFLKNFDLDYTWSIDFEVHETINNTLIYNFTEPGVKQISAKVTAFDFQNNDFKYGYFERTITAKLPVENVNVTGNPFLYHGDTLNLNISCNGTPPFVYCYDVLKHNVSHENFTCTHFSTFTTCHMEIMKYFQDDGTYNVGIYISNNVAEKRRVIEVMVYSVTIKPTLSTVIIPIVCSLLTLIIIAMGISYCVHQRRVLSVEVANFNFQEESADSYTERTFFENILDSVSCRNCIRGPFACGSRNSESEPLVCET